MPNLVGRKSIIAMMQFLIRIDSKKKRNTKENQDQNHRLLHAAPMSTSFSQRILYQIQKQASDLTLCFFQEGRSIVENKTADIIQETRKLQIRRRGGTSEEQNQVVVGMYNPWKQLSVQSTQPRMMQTTQENQLKASRDVRWHCGFYS